MASFTDQILQQTPYRQQLPVEAMKEVGMYKQAQYQEGVQKIQSQVDDIAGIDVARDVDKQYLQSKLNELGSNLKKVAAGDFSNFQLVNSVGGMAKQIIKDPNIQNAVGSTQWYRNQSQKIQKDVDEGKSNPANIDHFNKQASGWLNSKKAGEKFNGSYVPYFDVFKYAKETFDAVKPDGFSFDQVYVTDMNGVPKKDSNGQLIYSPIMVRMEQEGVMPAKVKETLSQIFSDPRVGQQLDITGQYNYKGYSPEMLAQKVNSQRNTLISSYKEKLHDLNLQKNLGKDVQSDIDNVQKQINTVSESYNTYQDLAIHNPDAVRGALYKDDVNTRFTTMFGHIKKKEQMMENPAWKANFDLQKESNTQSRWAQEFALKGKEFEFNKEVKLAELALKSIPKGTKNISPEQANQPSDIDVIHKLESDYTQTAEEFKNSSDEFLWNTTFSGLDNNDEQLTKLVNSGKSREESVRYIIDRSADEANQSPEEFRTILGNKGEIEYNKMTPAEREKNPRLANAHDLYRASRKAFDDINSINKKVNSFTEQRIGSIMSREISTQNIKPQQVVVGGKPYNLSKDDIYDIAVYLRGNQSSLGFLNDEGSRKASKSAESRLKQRGTLDVADALLRTPGAAATIGPITAIKRGIINPLIDVLTFNVGNRLSTHIDNSQINQVYNILNNQEYEQGLKAKADIIKGAYAIRPNLKAPILTGDAEGDRGIIYNLKRFAAGYTGNDNRQNISPDFGDFAKSLDKDPSKIIVEANVIMDANNNPQVEITSSDEKGSRVGGMTLQADEAVKLNIDVNSLYESKNVSLMRNKIEVNGNKTCAGNPKDVKTYVQGDAYFDKNDFSNLKGTDFDVKANIVYSNGVYYPYLYANDGEHQVVRELPGSSNLQQVNQSLRQLPSNFVKALLIE